MRRFAFLVAVNVQFFLLFFVTTTFHSSLDLRLAKDLLTNSSLFTRMAMTLEHWKRVQWLEQSGNVGAK